MRWRERPAATARGTVPLSGAMKNWHVLVVDDDDDVQRITQFALKRRSWRGGAIKLTPARSGKEARALLEAPDCPRFNAAIIDVEMETSQAGLELCDHIRARQPRSMRLVLRTGQGGRAPEEQLLRDYDIDYYLSKADVTEERLYATVRACFRTSHDIECMIAVRAQLLEMTKALQRPGITIEQLAALMQPGFAFLEERYETPILFVHDIASRVPPDPPGEPWMDYATAAAAVADAHAKNLELMVAHPGEGFGLPPDTHVIVTSAPSVGAAAPLDRGARFKRWLHELLTEERPPDGSGVVVRFPASLAGKGQREFLQDIEAFVGNWRLLSSSIRSSIVIFPQTKG